MLVGTRKSESDFHTKCCWTKVKGILSLRTSWMLFLKKKKKKAPSLPLICASVCHALSNPGWNVSGRGVQRPWRTEQQVKLNSLRTCPASQLLQKFYCKVQPDPVLHKSPNVRVSYYFIFLSDTRICFSWEEKNYISRIKQIKYIFRCNL